MLTPDYETYARLAASGGAVPVARTFHFDSETAVSAYHKLRSGPFGFLLESLIGAEKWARYTFLGTAPRSAWRLQQGGRVSTWTPSGGWTQPRVLRDPLADLDARLQAVQPIEVPGMPRFFGGAVGYIGYDVVRYIEDLPDRRREGLDLPEALLIFTDTVLAIDNVYGRAHAVTLVRTGDAADDAERRALYDDAVARLDAMVETLRTAAGPPLLPLHEPAADPAFTSSCTREVFEAGVERIRDYIRAGDAFQVVLSQRLSVPLRHSPLELYRRLRSLNPSPYLFLLELGDVALIGSSPEVLVRVEADTVTVRPIAGTRPRGRSEADDVRLAEELLADPKERAEHLMLVDLGRNDVGRVAEFGSVRVSSFMEVEKYSHVMHIVSQVEGTLRAGMSGIDVLRACFPAGTVSGAPKIRAMQIIDELEPTRRGIYAGAVGYFAWGGRSMDTAIAIRTVVAVEGQAHVQAGAGVVFDSVATAEYEETLAKARALLRSLAADEPAPAPVAGG